MTKQPRLCRCYNNRSDMMGSTVEVRRSTRTEDIAQETDRTIIC